MTEQLRQGAKLFLQLLLLVGNQQLIVLEALLQLYADALLAGAFLIVAFVGSYLLKLAFLGREDLSTWSAMHVQNLRVHETCVLLMIVAGVVALTRARRMRGSRERTQNPADHPAPASTVAWHHRAGWASVVAAMAGLATAAGILAGMYARLP